MITNVSQVPDALRIYEQVRKPRTTEIRNRTNAQKITYGLRDGPLQEIRDKELTGAALEGCPNALEDPTFQKWLWGYDAVTEAQCVWNAFVREKTLIAV